MTSSAASLAGERDRLGAELLGEAQVLRDRARDPLRPSRSVAGVSTYTANQSRAEARRHAPRRADERRGGRARARRRRGCARRRPRRFDPVLASRYSCICGVDALGGLSQGELAQRDEVALLEEALDARARPAPGRRPCLRASRSSSSSGGRSIELDLVGAARGRSRAPSRARRRP